MKIELENPLAKPTPVTVAADVTEGTKFRVANLRFTDNRAFDEETLRRQFPIKPGDLFQRDKVASGFDKLRELYGSQGYIDMILIPDATAASDSTGALDIKMLEGPQYHLEKLVILAQKELANELRARWQMGEGAIFDELYLATYVHDNRKLLPENFTLEDMPVIRGCPHALVQVRLLVDTTLLASRLIPQPVECDKSHDHSQ